MSGNKKHAFWIICVVCCAIITSSCGGGTSNNNGGSSTGPTSNPLTITSLSTNSSTPLSPLVITTSGGNTDAVTVTFSNSNGYSVSGPAISVASGSVTVGVPLYVDPSSNTTATGSVSVVLTQDGHASAPASFTIQDLPALSTYGTSVGQITHDTVIFEQILLGESLDEMQTLNIAMASNSKVASETSNAAATIYTTLIPGVNNARNDIDQVMLNNNTIFPWGTLSGGRQIQFDSTQLDFMDRVAALYLLQQFQNTPTITKMVERRHAKRESTAKVSVSPDVTMQTILTAITSANSVYSLTEDLRNSMTNSYSTGLAFVDGLQMVAESQNAEQFSSYVGLVSGLAHFNEAVNTQLNLILPTAACLASPGCNSSAYASELDSNETNAGVNAAAAVADAISNIPGILDLESDAASTVDEMLTSVVNIYNAAQSGALQNISSAALDAVSNTSFTGVLSNLGLVQSNVSISNNLGSAASLTGVQLQQCPPTSCTTNFDVTNVADTGGSYDLVVPLNISGISYGSMDIVAFDFNTNLGLVTESVNLTGLSPNAVVQVPAMSGTCNDSDYGAPDGDDPDCD